MEKNKTFRLSNDCKLFKYICPWNKNTVSGVCFLRSLCSARGKREAGRAVDGNWEEIWGGGGSSGFRLSWGQPLPRVLGSGRGGRMAVGRSGLGCGCGQPALWFFQSSQCWDSGDRGSLPHLQGHWGAAGLLGWPRLLPQPVQAGVPWEGAHITPPCPPGWWKGTGR